MSQRQLLRQRQQERQRRQEQRLGAAAGADGEQQADSANRKRKEMRPPEARPKGRGKQDRTTYKLTVSYYGPAFDGWMQQPPPDASVEGELARALAPLLGGARPTLASGGRTDKGVSAAAQAASFPSWADLSDCQIEEAAAEILARAEARLRERRQRQQQQQQAEEEEGEDAAAQEGLRLAPFRVVRVQRAPRSFHATWSADWRRYVYLFPLRAAAHGGGCSGSGSSSGSGDGAASGGGGGSSSGGGSGGAPDWGRCHEGKCPGCNPELLLPHEASEVDSWEADPEAVGKLLAGLEGRPLDFHAYARDTPKGAWVPRGYTSALITPQASEGDGICRQQQRDLKLLR
jgi:tRNA U38,U39,U40 pseudouridine synthase TruA